VLELELAGWPRMLAARHAGRGSRTRLGERACARHAVDDAADSLPACPRCSPAVAVAMWPKRGPAGPLGYEAVGRHPPCLIRGISHGLTSAVESRPFHAVSTLSPAHESSRDHRRDHTPALRAAWPHPYQSQKGGSLTCCGWGRRANEQANPIPTVPARARCSPMRDGPTTARPYVAARCGWEPRTPSRPGHGRRPLRRGPAAGACPS
jgi:hypothetical protein